MPNSRRIGADFSNNAQERSNIMDEIMANLMNIKHHHNAGLKVKEKANKIL